MIGRTPNADIVFCCDGCEAELNTGTDEFKEANAMRQREGWKVDKIKDTWIHLCPNCDAES